MSDDINNPEWYTEGGMDTDSYIGAKRLSWRRGQIIKYVTRAGKKPGNEELSDLQKAQWFLEKEIRQLERDALRKDISEIPNLWDDTRGHEEAERTVRKMNDGAHLTDENPGGCADPLYPNKELKKAAQKAFSSPNADNWINSKRIPAEALTEKHVKLNPADFPPVNSGDTLTIQELDEEEKQKGGGYLPPGTKFFATDTKIFIDGETGKVLKRVTTEWMNSEDAKKAD